jgi:two-component system chemotaxis response regulator CheB
MGKSTGSARPHGTTQPRKKLHVLVIDDSAVVRQVMQVMLTQVGGMKVTVAADPLIAMKKMERQRPDVIVLDLEMPRMDGLTFLRKTMAEDPIPVVICSSVVGRGTEGALRALEEGAVDVVAKPNVGVRNFLEESAVMLVDTVRAAAGARLRRRGARAVTPARARPKLTADSVLPARRRRGLAHTTDRVVAIGASTGGTEAVHTILEAMPVDGPGIVIVVHMPEKFTATFADRLNQLCTIDVKEASTGDRIVEGRALIAPGNRHTVVERSGAQYRVRITDGPLVSRHRPSVDVLFRSVAQAAGPNAVGVILTGMGDDGAVGLLEMQQAGAATMAQDEATSVVFGMPKVAIARGAAGQVVPLPRIAGLVLKRAARRNTRALSSTAGRRLED